MSDEKKGGFVATTTTKLYLPCCARGAHLLLVFVGLGVLDDGLGGVVPHADAFAVSVVGAVVVTADEDLLAVELLEPEFLSIDFHNLASGFARDGADLLLGSGGSGGGGGLLDGGGGGSGCDTGNHDVIFDQLDIVTGNRCSGSAGRFLGRADKILDEIVGGLRSCLLCFGGTTALFGSRICTGNLGHLLALLLLLRLVFLVVGLGFAAAAGVAGCDFGARGGRFGTTASFDFLLQVLTGDGDAVLRSFRDECLKSAFHAELLNHIGEPDALLALGVRVVKQAARLPHGHGSEGLVRFLAGRAERASLRVIGGALCEQAVVGAKRLATTLDCHAAPRDRDALFFRGFCEQCSLFGSLLLSLLGCLRGFLFGLLFSLGGFFGGFLFSFGGSFCGFLFGFGGGFRGFLVSVFGSLLFSPTGFFGGFPFSFLGSGAGFAFFVAEDGLGGFGGLFFGFLGGSYLLDGVAVSVEFDDFGLLGLGFLEGLGNTEFLESECDGRGFELSDKETTDRFAIEILTFAREHGNDDVDEFVADLGSHVVRHFHEALFHDRVRGESHGGISGVHCFVVDV
jgi:hypothetical protein